MPKYITQPEDSAPFQPRADEKELSGELMHLVYYIWDNYLQLYDNADDIFLLGVGNAYLGVKYLLQGRSRLPKAPATVSADNFQIAKTALRAS